MVRVSFTLACPVEKVLYAILGIVVTIVIIRRMAEGRLTVEDVKNHVLLYIFTEFVKLAL